MTNADGRKPEGAPERSPKAGAGAPSDVEGNGPKRFSVRRKLAVVARLLRGEPLELVARETNFSSNDGKNTKAERVEPEQKLVAGLRDVSREEHNAGDCHARDQISGLVDPEYGIRSEQNVPKRSAANSCHRSQQHESDDVHLLARGHKRP